MEEFNQDILLLSLGNFLISLYNFYGMYFMYHASFVIDYHPHYSLGQVYYCFLFTTIFQFIASVIAIKYFHVLGHKGGLAGIIVMSLITTYLTIFQTSILYQYLAYSLFGLIYQLVITANNIFLSTKYKGQMALVKYLNSM